MNNIIHKICHFDIVHKICHFVNELCNVLYKPHHIVYRLCYIVFRILPILIYHMINSNIHHNFALTMMAEFFMSLDDVGFISYHTSKILGGTVFVIEKLLSYSTYIMFQELSILPIILMFILCMHYYYPETEKTNILYMIIVIVWSIACIRVATPLQSLGMTIYAITDFDVAIYDSKIFGILLLPTYHLGLILLAIG